MKRVLSITLALVLALALLIPAAAADDSLYIPIITRQPAGGLIDGMNFMRPGSDISLSVSALEPVGGGTLSYAWYDYDWQEGDQTAPVATGAAATIATSKDMFDDPAAGMSIGSYLKELTYCVVITNTYTDGDGEEQTAFVKSELAEYTLVTDTLSAFLGPWKFAFGKVDGIGSAITFGLPFALFFSFVYAAEIGAINFMMFAMRSMSGLLGTLQP